MNLQRKYLKDYLDSLLNYFLPLRGVFSSGFLMRRFTQGF